MAGEPFRGSTALVTGASRGIGAELALLLARRGADLVLVARGRPALEGMADRCRAVGARVELLTADLGEPGAPARVEREVLAAGLVVDHLVNNAGVGEHGRFAEVPLRRVLEVLDLNVRAGTELARRFLPGMIARGRGGVLNVASTAAFQGLPYMAVYGASKAYLLAWSEAVWWELRGTGVRACCLCPGPVDTEFFAANGLRFRPPKAATQPARRVAEAGLRGYEAGRPHVVAGLGNRLGAWGTRFLPRRLVVGLASLYAREGS